jgi:hypothetical protein
MGEALQPRAVVPRRPGMRAVAVAIWTAFSATAALAQEAVFPFRADTFHVGFNAHAKAENTEREVRWVGCEKGRPMVCQYRFTSVLLATVTADEPQAGAKEVVLIYARPKHRVQAHYLYSYKIYADLVNVLSPEANEQARGEAMKMLLNSIHSAEKEEARVGRVRYTMDMKRAGVRFVARPLAE